MCQYKSGIATKDKLFTVFGVDSHENLIKIFGLNDRTGNPNFVRLEFLPPAAGSWLNFDKWTLKVDQDYRPEWFIQEEWAQRFRTEWLEKAQILTGDCGIVHGRHEFAEDAKITRLIGYSTIIYVRGIAQIEQVYDSAQIEQVYDSAQIKRVYGSAQIEQVYGSAQIINDFRAKQ